LLPLIHGVVNFFPYRLRFFGKWSLPNIKLSIFVFFLFCSTFIFYPKVYRFVNIPPIKLHIITDFLSLKLSLFHMSWNGIKLHFSFKWQHECKKKWCHLIIDKINRLPFICGMGSIFSNKLMFLQLFQYIISADSI
jgi:hypothetical protein